MDAPPSGRRWRVVATGPWDAPGWDADLVTTGCDVVCGPSIDAQPDVALAEAQLAELAAGADAILVSTRERVTARVLDAAPRLRIVAKATIGVEKIDLAAATARGVLVVNSPAPENIIGLAEATVGLIVAMAKDLLGKEARIRDGGWRDASTDGLLLAGRRVGIVGLGRVGTAVARRLAGWEASVVACDPYLPDSRFAELGVQRLDLGELLQTSDVVTLHVPLTHETRDMIGRAELASMRPGALIVNTSRGAVVDEQALIDALDGGRLAGAALDVFGHEPLPIASPLRRIDRGRLILTPHSIGSSRGSRSTGTKMAVEAILAALRGQVPENVLNPEAVSGWQRRWSPVNRLAGA